MRGPDNGANVREFNYVSQNLYLHYSMMDRRSS